MYRKLILSRLHALLFALALSWLVLTEQRHLLVTALNYTRTLLGWCCGLQLEGQSGCKAGFGQGKGRQVSGYKKGLGYVGVNGRLPSVWFSHYTVIPGEMV